MSYRSLSHTKWECKYHVVYIPKYRKKSIFGHLRHELGDVFRRLAEQKESRIEEGHLMPDHVHMMISIPPKYSVSQVIGYLKGKRSTLRGTTGSGATTLWVSTSGRVGISSRRWAGTKR